MIDVISLVGVRAMSVAKNAVATSEEAIAYQSKEMPTASAEHVGKITQYTGETDDTYTFGHFYKCVESSGVYAWAHIDFGATGLTASVVGNKVVLE